MNRIFKTKWSEVHQQYVVTNETQAGRGKRTKSAVTVAVAAAMFSGMAGATVMPVGTVHGYAGDPGVIGNQASWETAEYQKDWGLSAMNASKAYSLGFNGAGVTVGVMDSGALMQIHPELAGDRFSGTHVSGEYGSSGNRYPQAVSGEDKGLPYEKGEHYDVSGQWMEGVNDSHGTHVTGTVGANRDGNEFHGVSWGSDIVVGNTGATDDNNYGPFQDYAYFKAGWTALADHLVAANGEKRGGVINNSWGTNTRVSGKTPNKEGTQDTVGNDGYKTTVHLDVNTRAESEYEYYLFKKMYGDNPSFVDAAYDAVKDKNVVQVMTTGNRDMNNPYYRAAYPFFNPEAEKHWVAVAGLKQSKTPEGQVIGGHYELIPNFNEAGLAKYWTVVGPGDSIYSSTTGDHGEPGFAAWGGTSMAAPHVTGAMGVLMSRYDQMTALQVRDVMFTTANHKNADGTNMKGWDNRDGSTPLDGQVSDRMGWGAPDLEKGMYGIGQFLGEFDYDMASGSLDVWSNDITQVALDQRLAEDQKWMAETKNGTDITAGGDYVLGDKFVVKDGIEGDDSHVIAQADAEKYRAELYAKQAAAIQNKLDKGLYNGSLIKRGEGTLVVTGNNTYRGGTTVEGGTLLGFNDSFGVTGNDSSATANGKVTVNGGTFGILTSYNDQLTQKGEIKDTATDHSVDVTVNANGKLMIMAGQNAEMGDLKLAEGATIVVGSLDDATLKQAYNGKAAEGTLKVQSMDGEVKVASDLAFFESTVTPVAVQASSGPTTLNVTLERNDKVNFATFAQNANGSSIANAIEAQGNGTLFDTLLGSSASDVTATYNSLGNDVYLNAQNAGVVNGLTMVRVIKDEANGIGEGRSAEMANGTARLWATGVGSWGNFDYGMSDMDSDFYAGLLGAEIDVAQNTKVGLFFGAGQTDNKAGVNGKVKTDDLHFGVYGMTNIGEVTTVNFGIARTHQDAEGSRLLQVGSQVGLNGYKGDTDITQFYIEGNCKAMNTAAYQFEPYVGFNWIHVEADGFNEQVGNVSIASTLEDRDMQVTTLGVRAGAPFTIGQIGMTVKGDLAWSHFFGDNAATSAMNLDGVATKIEGGELEDVASVGLGVEAQLTKSTTFGLNYTGTYDSDIAAHGVFANVRMNF